MTTETKTFDETLRARLTEHKTAGRLMLSDLAQGVGRSVTAISRYLSKKPEGDVAELEVRIEDYLRNATKRRVIDIAPFETLTTTMFAALAEQIRKTGDVGLIHGPAGIGKTKAIELYSRANETCLTVTLARWCRSDAGIAARLFEQVSHRGWDKQTSRAVYLQEKLAGSKRLIIVDNAHRAMRGALQFLFDFHDATGCPIALVGNPEVLDAIRGNDQMFSRIGICRDLSAVGRGKRADDWMRSSARKLLAALLPDADEAVALLAEDAALAPGHLRTLKKQAVLAGDLMQTAAFRGRQAEAFIEAGKLLVRKAGEEED